MVPSPFKSLLKLASIDFERGARSRYVADRTRDEIAARVSVPHPILVGASVLQRHLKAGRRLLRRDKGPGAKLANRNGRAVIAELNRRPVANLKIVVGPVSQQSGRAG